MNLVVRPQSLALRAFTSANQADQLLALPTCLDCGRAYFYPRLHCPRCFGPRIEHRPPAEPIRVRSYAWIWKPQSPTSPSMLPALMIAASNADLTLLASGLGWADSDGPSLGETVELRALDLNGEGLVPVVVRPGQWRAG